MDWIEELVYPSCQRWEFMNQLGIEKSQEFSWPHGWIIGRLDGCKICAVHFSDLLQKPAWRKRMHHEPKYISQGSKNQVHPRSLTARPWKMMVWRFLSFWDYFRGRAIKLSGSITFGSIFMAEFPPHPSMAVSTGYDFEDGGPKSSCGKGRGPRSSIGLLSDVCCWGVSKKTLCENTVGFLMF